MPSYRAVVVVATFLSLACSDEARRQDSKASPERSIEVTRVEYGDDWPYTVDSGRLYCDPPGSNVVLDSGGKVYALNGRAMGNALERGYVNARDTITLKDENGFFTVGDTQKIIQRGLSLCR